MSTDPRDEFERRLEEEKLAALAEFAAGAGHEINNPLAVISGRAQLLARDEPHPERRRDLAVIHAQTRRIYEMIADLMLFARPPEPAPAQFDLCLALKELQVELSAAARDRAVALAISGDEACPIVADRDQILSSLRCVIENALEAVGRGGRIDLAVRRGSQEIHVEIADDGPGIAPEVRRHLFDPFYSGRQAGRGLGMGLAKAWRLITNHGGRVDVHGEPGAGTRFVITLPDRRA